MVVFVAQQGRADAQILGTTVIELGIRAQAEGESSNDHGGEMHVESVLEKDFGKLDVPGCERGAQGKLIKTLN